MKNNINHYLYTCIAIAVIFAPLASFANQPAQTAGRDISESLQAKLPSYYPNSFMGTGIVTSKNQSKRTIVIGGIVLAYGINTKVHTLSSNFSSIQSLPVGSAVGFNSFVDTNNTRFLTEAWVLPDGSVLAH